MLITFFQRLDFRDRLLILIISLSIIAAYIIATRTISSSKPYSSQPITPDSSIITFDIHGVLFKTNWRRIAGLLWADKKTCTLLLYLFNPWFIYDLFKLVQKGAVLEKCITYLSGNYPTFARHEKFIFLIANAQKPVLPMLDLLQNLKSQGYTLHIFSNIGTQLYEDLAVRFPQEFTLFDDAFTPDGFHGKSHKATFTLYLELFNPGNKQIVFIDNNKNNITIAKTVGIISIYYKNPQQLQEVLKELHVI